MRIHGGINSKVNTYKSIKRQTSIYITFFFNYEFLVVFLVQ